MSWMIGEHGLDPEQRMLLSKIRQDPSPRYWIRGPVGTGKSILLVHALLQDLRQHPSSRAAVVMYTHSLIDMFQTGLPQEVAGRVDFMTYHEFLRSQGPYPTVVVDEVQDLTLAALQACSARAGRLILAGDPFQSIYDETVTVQDILEVARATPFDLTTLHRLTPKIIDIAQLFYSDRLLAAKRGKVRNVDVTRIRGQGPLEFQHVWAQAAQYAKEGYSTAALFPKHEDIKTFVNRVCDCYGNPQPAWTRLRHRYDYDQVNAHLRRLKIPLQYVGNGHGSFKSAEEHNQVILMTYHSSKGMDFEAVFLPFLDASAKVWAKDPRMEDTLFFVALTRSREHLFLSYTDTPHSLLSRIPNSMVRDVEAPEAAQEDCDEEDDDFVF